jgi:CHAT domain-containing protein
LARRPRARDFCSVSAIIDEATPLDSALIFAARGQDEESRLSARELYNYQFSQVREVVLAACRTASGSNLRGESGFNLAQPFLTAGVPVVIASLWNADDEASAQLFQVFYEQQRAGKNAAEAMRVAQSAFINHPDPALRAPRVWASFQVFGGTMPHH